MNGRKSLIIQILYRLAVNTVGLGIAVRLFNNATIGSFGALLAAAVLLTICNYFVRPALALLTIPFLVLTLGLFYFIISGIVVMFVAWTVDGFAVTGLWSAIGVSVVVGLINFLFDLFSVNKKKY